MLCSQEMLDVLEEVCVRTASLAFALEGFWSLQFTYINWQILFTGWRSAKGLLGCLLSASLTLLY